MAASKQFKGTVNVDIRDSVEDWSPFEPPKAPEQKPTKPKSAWGKWYTWVAAGGVLILIGTLLIVDHVGDDKLSVTAKH